MSNISRQAYADMFGPTTGDKVRLADTDLWIEVEKDFTTYGEEVKFGGGKVIRDGMGQGQMRAQACADLVITNALIVDHWGIVKADIGIKDGRILAIGKAGNPDIQPNVTIPIGVGTEVIAGEGKIVTAGGVDIGVADARVGDVEVDLPLAGFANVDLQGVELGGGIVTAVCDHAGHENSFVRSIGLLQAYSRNKNPGAQAPGRWGG